MKKLTDLSINHPWMVIGIAVLVTAFFAYQFTGIKIDTDPENMLRADEPVRVLDLVNRDAVTRWGQYAEAAASGSQPLQVSPIYVELRRIDVHTGQVRQTQLTVHLVAVPISLVDDCVNYGASDVRAQTHREGRAVQLKEDAVLIVVVTPTSDHPGLA